MLAVDEVRDALLQVPIGLAGQVLVAPGGVIAEPVLRLATTPNAGAGVSAHQS
jgi:hypothetical protein